MRGFALGVSLSLAFIFGCLAAPDIPLEDMVRLPGTAVIEDGYLVPNDAPGFGIEIDLEWIEDRRKKIQD